MKREPTERQRQLLEVMLAFEHDHGATITIRRLRDAFGVHSTHAITYLLKGLERRGLVKRGVRGWQAVQERCVAVEEDKIAILTAQVMELKERIEAARMILAMEKDMRSAGQWTPAFNALRAVLSDPKDGGKR